jgi:serine/threonine protein kinase
MPERAAYDEAMRLSQVRLKVADPELKQGKVETMTLKTVAGSIQQPWGVQGGFAVVYKFSTHGGKLRALRCFLAKMDPDIQFRYEHIGTYFATHAPDISVYFKYHNDGVLLKETVYGQTQKITYPLVEMEWIDGTTLIEYIDQLCKKRDTATLADVVAQWCNIMTTLQQAQISHGDLAGGNIMVRQNGRLVLIDYDGVYIPSFAHLSAVVNGQVDYQHPQMARRPFNERTDDFSAWVIYTALLALQLQPELWQKYTQHNAQGEPIDTNLLFRKDDFVDPDQSSLFTELSRINDKQFQKALRTLYNACLQAVSQVPPFQIDDPETRKKQALEKLKQAIQYNDDLEIVQMWDSQQFDNYAPAQQYAARVTQARQVLQMLQDFQAAMKTRSFQQILAAFDPILLDSKQFPVELGEQLLLILPFAKAYYTDDDQAITSSWADIEGSAFPNMLVLTPEEQQRLSLAQQRKEALVKFRLALYSKNLQPIVASYNPSLLDSSTAVTNQERELLQVAQDFVQALQRDDDQAIVTASDAIQNFSYRNNFVFTTQEKQRIELAQQRKLALIKFRTGLISKNMLQIIASYNWILDDCPSMLPRERDLLRLAKAFVQASHSKNNKALTDAWEAIQQASYQHYLVPSPSEQQLIDSLRQNKTELQKFRLALASKSIQQIVASYDAVLDNNKAITHEERRCLELAQSFMQAYNHNDDQALVVVWEDMQTPENQPFFLFTQQERERADLAQQRKAALVKFRLALIGKRIQQIVTGYNPILDACGNITSTEQKKLALARQFVQAFSSNNDKIILSAWSAIQNSPYQKDFILTETEMTRIRSAETRIGK